MDLTAKPLNAPKVKPVGFYYFCEHCGHETHFSLIRRTYLRELYQCEECKIATKEYTVR